MATAATAPLKFDKTTNLNIWLPIFWALKRLDVAKNEELDNRKKLLRFLRF